jgi:hypothetical protein
MVLEVQPSAVLSIRMLWTLNKCTFIAIIAVVDLYFYVMEIIDDVMSPYRRSHRSQTKVRGARFQGGYKNMQGHVMIVFIVNVVRKVQGGFFTLPTKKRNIGQQIGATPVLT